MLTISQPITSHSRYCTVLGLLPLALANTANFLWSDHILLRIDSLWLTTVCHRNAEVTLRNTYCKQDLANYYYLTITVVTKATYFGKKWRASHYHNLTRGYPCMCEVNCMMEQQHITTMHGQPATILLYSTLDCPCSSSSRTLPDNLYFSKMERSDFLFPLEIHLI